MAIANSFVAIDFETANDSRDSACSLALVKVIGTEIVQRNYFLIRPPYREFRFTYLHGIAWQHVAHQPTFSELWPNLINKLNEVEFVAAHNASFDRSVLAACCRAYNLALPSFKFLCTVQLARSVWHLNPAKLPNVCNFLDIPLNHHQAESDAEACAKIVIAAKGQGGRLTFLREYQGVSQ
jgi:DNA polymerase III subunit epsilon